jgi:hypothetical protein
VSNQQFTCFNFHDSGFECIDNQFEERLLRKANGDIFAAEVAARSIGTCSPR